MSPAETTAFCLQHQVPFLHSTDVVRAQGPDRRDLTRPAMSSTTPFERQSRRMLENVSTDQSVKVVTGAAGGIGSAIVVALAEPDSALVLADARPVPEDILNQVEKAEATAHPVQVDLSDAAAVDEFAAALTALGRTDVLVNSAGIHPRQPDGTRWPITHVDRAMLNAMLAVNLTSPMVLCQTVAPLMTARGYGRIINISSLAARVYVDRVSSYYATTKGALTTFTRYLADELNVSGVTANSVAPGTIVTDLFSSGTKTSERTRLWFDNLPAQRFGRPEEVAELVRFLTTKGAEYITGAVIDINGGAV
ncbi:SDR family NAD(P)-dependent oxidoreductase [Streptomyces sp. NPDC001393]